MVEEASSCNIMCHLKCTTDTHTDTVDFAMVVLRCQCKCGCGKPENPYDMEEHDGRMLCPLCSNMVHTNADAAAAAYQSTKTAIEKELMKWNFSNIYLVPTYDGYFSYPLRSSFNDDLAFQMARSGDLKPDMMGLCQTYDYYIGQYRTVKFVVEVKRNSIRDTTAILQVVKYGMHFRTEVAIPLSLQGVYKTVIEFLRQRPDMLTYPSNGKVFVGCLDIKSRSILAWTPKLDLSHLGGSVAQRKERLTLSTA